MPLPPLRDRRDDIPSLATHFLEQHARRYRKNLSGFDSAAMDALLRHPWPGNVRELEHAIERAVLMAAGPTVAAGDLGLRRAQDGAQSLENMGLEDVEAFLIRKAVSRYGSVTEAAKALGSEPQCAVSSPRAVWDRAVANNEKRRTKTNRPTRS